jgi:hypothetical protein
MNDYQAFWEVPGFWPMILVLALVAAAATLAICFGPTETPYENDEQDVDMADVHVKTEWGFSLTEWNALTDQDRAYFRHHVTQATRAGDQ